MGVEMSLSEAIEIRRSRRSYDPTPIDPEIAGKLQQLIARYAEEAGLRMEFVLDNGAAFEGLRRSYGMFSGVRHYVGLIADDRDPVSAERLGYYGELLLLHAVAMGLAGCWVAGSYDKKACPLNLPEHEALICVIVLGNTSQDPSGKEKLIYNLIHRKTKSIEEMYTADTDVPDWFIAAMEAVKRAPSAINRQPVKFSYKEGRVSAWVEGKIDDMLALDFGIAKCHFALGAGKGVWTWGNHAEFSY